MIIIENEWHVTNKASTCAPFTSYWITLQLYRCYYNSLTIHHRRDVHDWSIYVNRIAVGSEHLTV